MKKQLLVVMSLVAMLAVTENNAIPMTVTTKKIEQLGKLVETAVIVAKVRHTAGHHLAAGTQGVKVMEAIKNRDPQAFLKAHSAQVYHHNKAHKGMKRVLRAMPAPQGDIPYGSNIISPAISGME